MPRARAGESLQAQEIEHKYLRCSCSPARARSGWAASPRHTNSSASLAWCTRLSGMVSEFHSQGEILVYFAQTSEAERLGPGCRVCRWPGAACARPAWGWLCEYMVHECLRRSLAFRQPAVAAASRRPARTLG